jgi:ribonuclease P protein component
VYDEGLRHSCPFFAAFCLKIASDPPVEAAGGPHVGFTVPKALGKAVVRNRLRRRVREAVRLHLPELPASWWIVFNPRRPALSVPFPELEKEVQRLFRRCATS